VSGAYASWSSALLVGLAMLIVGVRLNLLSMHDVVSRCGACGRLRRRGTLCPCTRPDDD
jgi:hypothetical protein